MIYVYITLKYNNPSGNPVGIFIEHLKLIAAFYYLLNVCVRRIFQNLSPNIKNNFHYVYNGDKNGSV